ncbi:MAG: hypothetical protein JWP74_1776 [Marmoricola sp.]|nr:hypothetical protein [Marmoricola sp.]
MNKYAKAILAAAVALVGGIAVGYADDTLTRGEFWAAASAAVVALAGVFGIPNAPADRDPDPVEEDPDYDEATGS